MAQTWYRLKISIQLGGGGVGRKVELRHFTQIYEEKYCHKRPPLCSLWSSSRTGTNVRLQTDKDDTVMVCPYLKDDTVMVCPDLKVDTVMVFTDLKDDTVMVFTDLKDDTVMVCTDLKDGTVMVFTDLMSRH